MAGTDLMTVLLDTERSATCQAPPPWRPAPAPSDARLLLEAALQLASTSSRRLASAWGEVLNPRRSLASLTNVVAGFRSFAQATFVSVKGVSVQGSIGPNRRWAAARARLDDIASIRAAFGGSVNDVVLTAIAGAFRALLLDRGERVTDEAVLHSLVPVSVRDSGDHSANNQVSLIIAQLPIGIADPIERLAAVHNQMKMLKSSHEIESGHAVVTAAELVPPAALALAARTIMTVLHTLPQRVINTVTTNVPGPQFPLYALGREMLEYLPYVPVSEGLRIGVAIMSYNGAVNFGITGDYDTAPDVNAMARHIESELAALHTSAGRPNTDGAVKGRSVKRERVAS